jgi:succinate dehydrogenase/fumarate reductase flavoprotein subunit
MVAWQQEADVVVIGSGACGLPAAIAAREAGASVVLVEAEADIGGHAITSGGNVPLGGGTSVQKKYGIADTPDLVFKDLTDWSVVEPNGAADYRYNDREIIRVFADESAPTFEWLLQHGVAFHDKSPDQRGGGAVGNSVPREMHAVPLDVPLVQTGEPVPDDAKRSYSTGNGLMRPLESAARKAGVEILLQHRMTGIHRERGNATGLNAYPNGRVIGIEVTHGGKTFNIRTKKAVIVATGGRPAARPAMSSSAACSIRA